MPPNPPTKCRGVRGHAGCIFLPNIIPPPHVHHGFTPLIPDLPSLPGSSNSLDRGNCAQRWTQRDDLIVEWMPNISKVSKVLKKVCNFNCKSPLILFFYIFMRCVLSGNHLSTSNFTICKCVASFSKLHCVLLWRIPPSVIFYRNILQFHNSLGYSRCHNNH